MNLVTYKVKTECAGWSVPLTIRVCPALFDGGVNGTAFALIGRRHPGAVGIELLAVRKEDA